MAKIGNWWLARCQAQPGEIGEWSCLANHTHSPNRAVGGKLFLTNQRLLFCPHLIDYALAARRWEADLTAVRGIVREPPGGEGITGLTDRVRIVLADDSAAWFLVNSPWQPEKLQQVIDHLQQAVRASGGQLDPDAGSGRIKESAAPRDTRGLLVAWAGGGMLGGTIGGALVGIVLAILEHYGPAGILINGATMAIGAAICFSSVGALAVALFMGSFPPRRAALVSALLSGVVGAFCFGAAAALSGALRGSDKPMADVFFSALGGAIGGAVVGGVLPSIFRKRPS